MPEGPRGPSALDADRRPRYRRTFPY